MADTCQVLNLAAIIRKVDGNHSKGAAALAESILDHPNFRALCAELHAALDRHDLTLAEDQLLDRSAAALRAALADEPAAGEPTSVIGQPSDGELNDTYWAAWHEHLDRTNSVLHSVGLRAVLARWGSCQGILQGILDSSAPAPAGEVGELIGKLVEAAPALAEMGWDQHAQRILRAADLLQHLSPPQPVPVSERLQQMEDLAADAVAGLRYIEQSHGRLYGVGWDRVYKKADRLKPAHALPLPGQEVEG